MKPGGSYGPKPLKPRCPWVSYSPIAACLKPSPNSARAPKAPKCCGPASAAATRRPATSAGCPSRKTPVFGPGDHDGAGARSCAAGCMATAENSSGTENGTANC